MNAGAMSIPLTKTSDATKQKAKSQVKYQLKVQSNKPTFKVLNGNEHGCYGCISYTRVSSFKALFPCFHETVRFVMEWFSLLA